MGYTNEEKVVAFKKHWKAFYGPIWNDDGEWDVYHNWIIKKDPFMVRDAIWSMAESNKEHPKLRHLAVAYKKLENAKKREENYRKEYAPKPPLPECEVCNSEGLSWCIVAEVAEIYPCNCRYGILMFREFFIEKLTLFQILELSMGIYKLGCFKTEQEANDFIIAGQQKTGV